MNNEEVEKLIAVLGASLVVVGAGFLWGWPASLIVFGSFLIAATLHKYW